MTTTHSNCTHPSTKTARAKCRRDRANAIVTVTTVYGTFEVKTICASEIQKGDEIFYGAESGNFFSPATLDAFQTETVKGGQIVKSNTYMLALGGARKYVAGDTTYTVAANNDEVKAARKEYQNKIYAPFRKS